MTTPDVTNPAYLEELEEPEHSLIREYRPSMDRDTLHDWAKDVVVKMREDRAALIHRARVAGEMEEALRAIALSGGGNGPAYPQTYKGGFDAASDWSAGVAGLALDKIALSRSGEAG